MKLRQYVSAVWTLPQFGPALWAIHSSVALTQHAGLDLRAFTVCPSESIQILGRSDLVFLRIVSGQPPFQDFIDIAAALLTESGSLTGFSKPSFRKLESKVCGGFASCFLPPKVCQLSCYRTVSGQSCLKDVLPDLRGFSCSQ